MTGIRRYQSTPVYGRDAWLDCTSAVETGFQRARVQIKSQSRVAKALAIVQRHVARSRLGPQQPSLELDAASKAVEELAWFFRFADKAKIASDRLASKLRTVQKDNLLPTELGANTPGHDAQLELFVAGLLAAGGIRPALGDESVKGPDLLCHLPAAFAIEVKRVKSVDAVPGHFRTAVGQLGNVPGVVVFDAPLPADLKLFDLPADWQDRITAYNAERVLPKLVPLCANSRTQAVCFYQWFNADGPGAGQLVRGLDWHLLLDPSEAKGAARIMKSLEKTTRECRFGPPTAKPVQLSGPWLLSKMAGREIGIKKLLTRARRSV